MLKVSLIAIAAVVAIASSAQAQGLFTGLDNNTAPGLHGQTPGETDHALSSPTTPTSTPFVSNTQGTGPGSGGGPVTTTTLAPISGPKGHR